MIYIHKIKKNNYKTNHNKASIYLIFLNLIKNNLHKIHQIKKITIQIILVIKKNNLQSKTNFYYRKKINSHRKKISFQVVNNFQNINKFNKCNLILQQNFYLKKITIIFFLLKITIIIMYHFLIHYKLKPLKKNK